MPNSLVVSSLLLFVVLLAGCDTQVEQATPAVLEVDEQVALDSRASVDAEIAWFEGSVEAAFSTAEAEAKPLFFYWGAVWCPPCQEIKHTVFKSQQFIELTRLFVPVYLDGDTQRAQTLGEQYGVKGYPTMIVFNPAGEEVTRIPGGIDIERYNGILELSLNQMKPTAELVQIALSSPEQLTEQDLKQLAYYSWGQDSHAVPEDTDTASMFYRLSEVAKSDELSARFYLAYLVTLSDESEEETPVSMMEGDDPVTKLQAILSDDHLTVAGWDTLAYWSEDILSLPGLAENDELASAWSEAVFTRRLDDRLSKAEKLAGWLPKTLLLTREDQMLPETVATALREEMQRVDEATPDTYERQSVISQISYVYRSAGLQEDARQLLLAELDKSASPYYFMSGLGAFAEAAEDYEQALNWRRQAYETSKGEATRFQWGTNYVLAMIRMAPEDIAPIQAVSGELLASFEQPADMFSGRNYRVLRRLHEKLLAWQEAQKGVALAFHDRVKALCEGQAADTQASSNCQSLLSSAANQDDNAQAS